ncbi:ABC transporter substrate-binding protein [Paenibacillus taichungensis]|jgi:peptide/nickel transport system substrate-binding protein|uniref:ABC transporter substrate-binding protein n=1 Tax=Paenibacillus taichungensis TaxID=484184 RepID=A0ABX2MEF5_9BACL|nr:ABC transporter substrate-binding protein [Paenibacillus sp. ALJ109b]NUU53300.1 ABC transporter substrate-binding protein [Paenibacillus taichungensis]OME77588.1 ABC transporter substrate-binding protein [Paenibacillus pabuli]PIH56003.1 ABC transporter substrate-binding protein [Paenibacillus sp. LK1]
MANPNVEGFSLKRKSNLLIVLVLITTILGGCSASSSNNENEESTVKEPVVTDNSAKEAPMLAKLVDEGKLPALAERLPASKDIMVEEVVEEIGQYGGDWNMPWTGVPDKWGIGQPTEEALFRFNKEGNKVEPNVAKSYEVNDDSTVFTIHLREGMKWSDGVPFTADDVLFYWEHMLTKETFGKKIYDAYYSVDPVTGDRALAEVKKVDDYTFTVTHKYPSVLFLERVAIDNKWFFAPAHFHKTILPEFVGDAKTLEITKQWGYEDPKVFLMETGYTDWLHYQIPTLRAWVPTNDPNGDQFVMERNPYYWKTDKEGKQLPYIDRIVATKIQDPSQKVLGTLAGDYNLVIFDSKDFTVLKENEKKGDYRIIPWTQPAWSSAGVQLNQTTEDPNLRKLFQDIKFREALSIGVDRNQVSEIVTSGLGEPIQASVPEGVMGYQEGWAQQWAEYDPERANQILDELGLNKRDKDNFRLNPDGSELTLTVIESTTDTAPFLELLKKYYEDMGLRTNLKVVDGGTHFDMKYANKIPMTTENISVVNVAFRPDTMVPLRVITPWFGHYGLYSQSGGKEGVKPEGDVAKILEYWEKVKASKTLDEINQYSNEIVKLHQKNQWVIGYAGPTPVLITASNKIHNIPTDLIWSDEYRSLGQGHPAQFFIKQ